MIPQAGAEGKHTEIVLDQGFISSTQYMNQSPVPMITSDAAIASRLLSRMCLGSIEEAPLSHCTMLQRGSRDGV